LEEESGSGSAKAGQWIFRVQRANQGYRERSAEMKIPRLGIAAGAHIKFGGMFFEGFMKEFGSTRCKEVLKHQYGRSYDFLNPEEQKLFMEASNKSNKCLEVVKKAVSIAGKIILENS
jgi:hypothetical protein